MSEDPRVLREALISFVNAVGDSPAGAALCRRALCAIVGISVLEAAVRPPPSQAHVTALEEIAQSLGMAAHHAEFLAVEAGRASDPSRR